MESLTSLRWQRPEKNVWRLVCGFPEALAREKILAMLRLYIDDSGKEDQSPVQVLAGYVATAEQWAMFSNDWKTILDEAGIEEFKMNDAWRLSREYQPKGHLARDSIIVKAICCIRKHARAAVGTSIRFDHFYNCFDPIGDRQDPIGRPYYMGFFSVLSMVYGICHKARQKDIEIIFDKQGGESEAYILSNFYEFKKIIEKQFPGLSLHTPMFQDSRAVLPLQAADLLAWLLRRDALNCVRGRDRSQCAEDILLQEALAMPRQIKFFDSRDIKVFQDTFIGYLKTKYPEIFPDLQGE